MNIKVLEITSTFVVILCIGLLVSIDFTSDATILDIVKVYFTLLAVALIGSYGVYVAKNYEYVSSVVFSIRYAIVNMFKVTYRYDKLSDMFPIYETLEALFEEGLAVYEYNSNKGRRVNRSSKR